MSKFKDLTDYTFGRWTVLSYSHFDGGGYWLCRCECGLEIAVHRGNLLSGKSKGCRKCNGKSQRKKFPLNKYNTYHTWRNIINRCCRPNDQNFKDYGGRGITICEEWRWNFLAFWEDMGPKPSPKHSIDRIDNNKGYYKANCRWATQKEQMRNTRTWHADHSWQRIL